MQHIDGFLKCIFFSRIEDFLSQNKKSEEHIRRKEDEINELEIRFVNFLNEKWKISIEKYVPSNFTCAESNANEQHLLFLLISIRFSTCEVRRLNRA